jgi:ATP-dependent protease ClpP protease subunit
MSPNPIQEFNEKQVRIDRDMAEASKLRSEERREHWQAQYNEASFQQQRMTVDSIRERHEWERAADFENRIYHLIGELDAVNLHACGETLSRWARIDSGKPVEVQITSPGGDAFHGMALFDHIMALRANGLYVVGTVRGTAASMGAILLQACSKRRAGPCSTQVLHKISTAAFGSLDQIEDRTTWMKIIQEQVYDIFAERCGASGAAEPLTRDEIVRNMDHRDWSLNPQDQLRLGLIDEIG